MMASVGRDDGGHTPLALPVIVFQPQARSPVLIRNKPRISHRLGNLFSSFTCMVHAAMQPP